jgi:RNA 2',3'-cyclic 3'-phosphodiesterase
MNSPHPHASPLRLFLALWPGPSVRRALAAASDAWRWPATAARVAPERMHLTLHFLGDVPRDRVPTLARGLCVPCARFELRFGQPAVWPPGTALLLPDAAPAALLALHAALQVALAALGMATERRAFRPHVTLARHAASAVTPRVVASLRWPVRGYALMCSLRDAPGGYRVLMRYP